MRASQRFGPKRKQKQIRRHFAERVSDKKQARAQSVDRGAEVQVGVHAQRGKADVDAVHVSEAVANADDRQEPKRGFTLRGCADGSIARRRSVRAGLESEC